MIVELQLGAIEMCHFGKIDDLLCAYPEETRYIDLSVSPIGISHIDFEVDPNAIMLRDDNLKRVENDRARLSLNLFEVLDVRLNARALRLLISDHDRIWREEFLHVCAIDLFARATHQTIDPFVGALQKSDIFRVYVL